MIPPMKEEPKILTGDVAMITEGILCKTCKELDIEIIENRQEIKRQDKPETQERIPPSQGVL